VSTIKIKDRVGLGLAVFFLMLGGLSISEILVVKTKYIFCVSCAIFILMLAALVFEIAEKSRGIIWLKFLYLITWSLLGGTVVVLVILPLVVTWQDWRPYNTTMTLVNLGVILWLFFLKEVVRDWKRSSKKWAKPQPQNDQDCYFKDLPRVMRRKKRINDYFE
jgi:magnesium-transporting ATPase (P-type)